jgi:hypothetical protein
MKEREQLEQAITALEAQRSVLGDTVVEAALAPLREKLAALNKPTSELFTELGRVEAGETASLTGERRVVTILFCDIKGSTAMAEQLDPEEWAGIIQRALEHLTERYATVERYGAGRYPGFRGCSDDDPQRSVIAGLEILMVSRSFTSNRRARVGFLAVGIHTGRWGSRQRPARIHLATRSTCGTHGTDRPAGHGRYRADSRSSSI